MGERQITPRAGSPGVQEIARRVRGIAQKRGLGLS
jgi:hypothetical protein